MRNHPIKILSVIAMAAIVAAGPGMATAWADTGQPAAESAAAVSPTFIFGELKPVPAGSELLTVPVIAPGQPATVTVLGPNRQPLTNASVLVEGVVFNTDYLGQARLQIPRAQSVNISILDGNRKVIQERKYSITSGGLLVCEPKAVDVIGKLSEFTGSKARGPVISYAPLVVQASQQIVLLGRNFAATPGDDQVVLDGLEAPVLAASPYALLAETPPRLSIGPVRDLLVHSAEESSAVREVDVCRVEVVYREKTFEAGKTYRARVGVLGTNLPCLVKVHNETPAAVQVTADNKPITDRAIFITPGGEANNVILSCTPSNPQEFKISAELLPDLPGMEGYSDDVFSRALEKDRLAGDITRLQRRLITIENRLLQARQQSEARADKAPEESERLTAEERQLVNRQARLTSMLNTNRALLESFGGTETDYRQALAQASEDNANPSLTQPPTLSMIKPAPEPEAVKKAPAAAIPSANMKVLGAQAEEGAAQKAAAEKAASEAAEKIASERAARQAAEKLAQDAARKVAEERAAREAAEKLASEAQAKAAAERAARETAEKTAAEKAALAQTQKAAAEQAALEAQQKAAAERAARVASEKSAAEMAAQEAAGEKIQKQAAQKEAQQEAERLAAEKAKQDALDKLAQEKAARLAAEKAAQETAQVLAAEKAAREAAEKAAKEAAQSLASEKAAKEEAQKLAAEKAAQEAAAKLAAQKASQEAALKLAAEEAAEQEARKLAEEKAAQEMARKLAEEKAAREAAARVAAEKAAREAAQKLAAEKVAREAAESWPLKKRLSKRRKSWLPRRPQERRPKSWPPKKRPRKRLES